MSIIILFYLHIACTARITYQKNQANNTDDADVVLLRGSYQTIAPCETQFTSGNGPVQITSPHFPFRYPYNARCVWNVTIPENKKAHIAFSDFSLTAPHFVEITAIKVTTERNLTTNKMTHNTMETVLGTFMNDTVPSDIITEADTISVAFSSAINRDDPIPVVSSGFSLQLDSPGMTVC